MWPHVFLSFGFIPRHGIARSNGNSMFKIMRNAKLFLQILPTLPLPLLLHSFYFYFFGEVHNKCITQ